MWSVCVCSLRTQQRVLASAMFGSGLVVVVVLVVGVVVVVGLGLLWCRARGLGAVFVWPWIGWGRLWLGGPVLSFIDGEFDPGSGRTLAACLTHASRANLRVSGERVSNTWATCPRLWDNSKKLGLIPDIHG